MNDTREKEIKEFLNTNFSFGIDNIELYNELSPCDWYP